MNKFFMTGLYFIFSKLMQGTGSSVGMTENLTKLRMASVYLHVVKISRLLCMTVLGAWASLILLLVGLMLIHLTILFYVPWDTSIKAAVTLISAALYILAAGYIFNYVFAEDKWMKMFNTEAVLKELTDKSFKA